VHSDDDVRPATLLPLPPATFHILLSLAAEDRHGYAIIQDVAARTGGEVRLSAGTLYRSIQRMLEQELLVEIDERPSPEDDDERRRYYRITPLGVSERQQDLEGDGRQHVLVTTVIVTSTFVQWWPVANVTPVLVVEDERHQHVDAVFRDRAVLDADVLFLDPGAADVAQRLVSPREALLQGVFEALG
jgi:DNA-binding PadR family transcriptional regulator